MFAPELDVLKLSSPGHRDVLYVWPSFGCWRNANCSPCHGLSGAANHRLKLHQYLYLGITCNNILSPSCIWWNIGIAKICSTKRKLPRTCLIKANVVFQASMLCLLLFLPNSSVRRRCGSMCRRNEVVIRCAIQRRTLCYKCIVIYLSSQGINSAVLKHIRTFFKVNIRSH